MKAPTRVPGWRGHRAAKRADERPPTRHSAHRAWATAQPSTQPTAPGRAVHLSGTVAGQWQVHRRIRFCPLRSTAGWTGCTTSRSVPCRMARYHRMRDSAVAATPGPGWGWAAGARRGLPPGPGARRTTRQPGRLVVGGGTGACGCFCVWARPCVSMGAFPQEVGMGRPSTRHHDVVWRGVLALAAHRLSTARWVHGPVGDTSYAQTSGRCRAHRPGAVHAVYGRSRLGQLSGTAGSVQPHSCASGCDRASSDGGAAAWCHQHMDRACAR